MAQFILSAASLALLVFTLIDIITIDSWRIRHLDKVTWVIIVILLPLIGAVLWYVIGRPRAEPASGRGEFRDPIRQEVAAPLDDDDIDAAVEREIEFHERQARLRRLEAELRARRGTRDDT
jgi:hypothetical protein